MAWWLVPLPLCVSWEEILLNWVEGQFFQCKNHLRPACIHVALMMLLFLMALPVSISCLKTKVGTLNPEKSPGTGDVLGYKSTEDWKAWAERSGFKFKTFEERNYKFLKENHARLKKIKEEEETCNSKSCTLHCNSTWTKARQQQLLLSSWTLLTSDKDFALLG